MGLGQNTRSSAFAKVIGEAHLFSAGPQKAEINLHSPAPCGGPNLRRHSFWQVIAALELPLRVGVALAFKPLQNYKGGNDNGHDS
jgi:hypothetical protein